MPFSYPNTYHMRHPSQPSSFDNPDGIRRAVLVPLILRTCMHCSYTERCYTWFYQWEVFMWLASQCSGFAGRSESVLRPCTVCRSPGDNLHTISPRFRRFAVASRMYAFVFQDDGLVSVRPNPPPRQLLSEVTDTSTCRNVWRRTELNWHVVCALSAILIKWTLNDGFSFFFSFSACVRIIYIRKYKTGFTGI